MSNEASEKTPSHVITDDLEIIGIFKAFLQRKEKLWLWQKKDTGAQRIVHYGLVKKIDGVKKFIEIRPNNTTGFKLNPKEPLFLYSTKRSVALKCMMRECEKDFLVLAIPARLNFIQGDFLQNMELVEKENEQAHAHERKAPRKQANDDQIIGLRRQLGSEVSSVLIYKFYDISQGGMAFEVYDPAEFVIGDEVVVLYIDDKPLKEGIKGKVVSVRQLPDNPETFKIGVQFQK